MDVLNLTLSSWKLDSDQGRNFTDQLINQLELIFGHQQIQQTRHFQPFIQPVKVTAN